jgi:hypothetical protein
MQRNKAWMIKTDDVIDSRETATRSDGQYEHGRILGTGF